MDKREYTLLAITDEGYTIYGAEEAKELIKIMHEQFLDTFFPPK